MIRTSLVVVLAILTPLPSSSQADDEDAIAPWPENRFYWQYKGRPTLLIGGTDDYNLFQWPDEELRQQLDTLRSAGGNYVRNTMSDRPWHGWEVAPFRQLDNGQYDLEAWNPEYWRRLERFLRWTEERAILVQIEVWDRFDLSLDPWATHPYNPNNNVNFTYETSGFAADYPEHPGQNRHPFFFTTPQQQDNTVVLRHQQRFVDRLLSSTLRFSHILYCIDNETSGEEAWSRYWAEYIKRRARAREKTIYVTEMWDAWDITTEQHRRTFDHPELYDFVDVSQNNQISGVDHWRNARWVRQYLAAAPRPINSVKVYGADGNKFGHTDRDGLERFFRHLLAGAAAVRFHRPPSGLGLGEQARAALRAARSLESRVPLWTLTPRDDVLTSDSGDHVYVAEGDALLVLYLPDGGRVAVDMPDGDYQVHWIGVGAEPVHTTPGTNDGALTLSAPSNGHWLAVVGPRDPED